ncbi:hypothetical protein PpBr36_08420 [Pyricularia pennisetigena]|uniref:hypothetical protein n=1 Tax=Pyricularia pennisetigena TaxID=1578925 RepID=UPI001154C45B|nr:hypothetical protein PpBr36_08420 [Pyricularia pennisetigena]TLS24344.1 hypothetical protein PpBr36_08420 [Pyricularia pennisetigena]
MSPGGGPPPPLDETKANWLVAYIFVGIIIPIGYLITIGIIVMVDRREKSNPRSDATRRALEADGAYGRMSFPWRDAVRTTEPDTANFQTVDGPQTDDEKDILRQLELQRETQGWVPRPLGVNQVHEAEDGQNGGYQSPRHNEDPYLSHLKETGLGRSSMDGPYRRRDSLYSIDVEKGAGAGRMASSPVNPYSDINPYSSSNHNGVHRSASSSTNNSYRHSFDVRRNPFSDDDSVVDLTGNGGGSLRQQRQRRDYPDGDEQHSRRNPFSDDHAGSRRPVSLYDEPLRRPDPSHLV